MSRATQLDVDEVRRLDHFATSLDIALPANVGIIHVGSSLERPDYRDVDVRIVLRDGDYRALAKRVNILDLNMLLSGWGRQMTGMRIDAQVQSLTESSATEGKRNGIKRAGRNRPPLDKANR